jgi:hypothetical protein
MERRIQVKTDQLTGNIFIYAHKLINQFLFVVIFGVSLFSSACDNAKDNRFSMVYNPQIRLQDDLDYSNLDSLVNGLFNKYNAGTPREKAEAIWRFLLPSAEYGGQAIYKLAGWAYEEPNGQVLDPLKLLNVYGYFLCYQVAPLAEALYDAAGFEDARVWFLNGHNVSEVFYEGEYHHFDNTLMGYSVKSEYRNPKTGIVAGLQDIIKDTTIITGKLLSPKTVDTSLVVLPWYPYDVRLGVMKKILSLITTTDDNWIYYDRRYSSGYSMHYILRKGEKLVRYFGNDGYFYLPYKKVENSYLELPKDIPRYEIWVKNGPKALRGDRTWGTGKLVYSPDLTDSASFYQVFSKNFNHNLTLASKGKFSQNLKAAKVDEKLVMTFKMQSPYLFIDAEITGEILQKINPDRLKISFSTDWGRTWSKSRIEYLNDELKFKACPETIVKSQHGQLTAIAGKYNYLVRIELLPDAQNDIVGFSHIIIKSRILQNPRILPTLQPGENNLMVTYGEQAELQTLRPDISQIDKVALKIKNVKYVFEEDQGFLRPDINQSGTIIFKIKAPCDGFIQRLQIGGRFLKLEKIAPDKLTAEIRKIRSGFNYEDDNYQALIRVSDNDSLSYKKIWEFDKKIIWRNGRPIKQFLRWPEVDQTVYFKTPVKSCYVEYQLQNIVLDKIRFNLIYQRSKHVEMSQKMVINHVWQEDGIEKVHTEIVRPNRGNCSYTIGISGKKIVNKSLTIEVIGESGEGY